MAKVKVHCVNKEDVSTFQKQYKLKQKDENVLKIKDNWQKQDDDLQNIFILTNLLPYVS